MSQHQIHVGKTLTIFLSLILVGLAIPTSVLEDLMTKDVTNKKVKRAQIQPTITEKSAENQKDYFYPSAIKRGGGSLKSNQLPLLTEWDQQRYRQQAAEGLPPSLYSSLEDVDGKSVSEYEKGYRYATNRDKLDEALENAILKSEMYGEPAAVNQYRYYGIDDMKRKRRNVNPAASNKKLVARAHKARRITNRLKREADLSPEEILAILTLWENERMNNQKHRQPWQTYDDNNNNNNNDFDSDSDEDWMDTPVYPHASDEHMTPPSPNYYYDVAPPYYEKRGRWGGFSESRRKRFMVAKKRTDPTRELRYLNGPSHNDYYTLSELLANQRDPDVPLYQRYML